MFVSVPGMLIPYVVLQCRSDRYLPTVFCELFLLGTCTFLCFSAISNVLYTISTVLATWCVAVVLMSTPLEPLWLVLRAFNPSDFVWVLVDSIITFARFVAISVSLFRRGPTALCRQEER